VFVTSSGGVAGIFATPRAAYANPLRSANFYIILNNYAICASAHGSSRPAGRIIQIMQKSAGSVPRPTLLSGVLCGRYAVCLCRVAASATAKAQAHKSASGSPPAQDTYRHSLLLLQASAAYAQARRSPTLCLFVAIATALLSGLRRTRGSATNSHSYGGSGLGFSVTSLPQCRRGAFPASIRAVCRLPQGRYAVGCAATRQEKEKRFCKCFCRLFFKQLHGWGKGWLCW